MAARSSPGILTLEEARIACNECLQLTPDSVEVVRHCLSRSCRLMFDDRGMDCSMFREAAPHASGLREQRPACPFEMGSNGIKHLVHSNQVESVSELAMEARVEFMKTLDIATIERRTLVGEILGALSDRPLRQIARACRDDLSFQRAAH
jgi:hypothetical protein